MVLVVPVDALTPIAPCGLRRVGVQAERAQNAKTKEQTTSKGSAESVRRFVPVETTAAVRNVILKMQ